MRIPRLNPYPIESFPSGASLEPLARVTAELFHQPLMGEVEIILTTEQVGAEKTQSRQRLDPRLIDGHLSQIWEMMLPELQRLLNSERPKRTRPDHEIHP